MNTKFAKYVVLLGVFCAAGATAQTRTAPEPTERTPSPYDSNPACRDRDVASTDPACVIQSGPPAVRQFGFDSVKPQPPLPGQPQNSAAPPVTIVVPPQGKAQAPAAR